MSVLRQQNWLGQQRVDVPHLRSLDSAISADFDLLAGSIVSGGKALVVRGFDLIASTGPATALQLNVAGGILMHQDASEAGTIFSVVDDATVETLDGTNPNVSGSFTPGQVNYVGLDLVRAADSSTSDLVMFWDPNSSDETPKTVPLARTLGYRIVISTTDFDSTPNILPIAKVTTTSLNVVASVSDIVDARQLAFRLGSGGSSPDKGNAFAWPEGRDENTASTGFSGADKAISSLKDWMDAAMTRLWELGGGEFWYSPTADRNVVLVSTGTVFPNGENFSWDGTNLSWQGLQFLFDNSTGWYNEVKAQTASSAGLTDLADGECIYVDLDRSQNLSGATALVPLKAELSTLGTGSIPGARQVIAWRRGTSVFTKGSKYPVGAQFSPATSSSLGLVKLDNNVPDDPANPTVVTHGPGGSVALTTAASITLTVANTSSLGNALKVQGGTGLAVNVTSAGCFVNLCDGDDSTAINASSTGADAIHAASTGGYGVYGTGSSGGLYGTSASGPGVFGNGTSAQDGVKGTSGTGRAVAGYGGTAAGSIGVYGTVGAGALAAIYGIVASGAAPGVYGTGTAIGVHGKGGAGNAGVKGEGGSAAPGGQFIGNGSGAGVEATGGASGPAILAHGDVKLTGAIKFNDATALATTANQSLNNVGTPGTNIKSIGSGTGIFLTVTQFGVVGGTITIGVDTGGTSAGQTVFTIDTATYPWVIPAAVFVGWNGSGVRLSGSTWSLVPCIIDKFGTVSVMVPLLSGDSVYISPCYPGNGVIP